MSSARVDYQFISYPGAMHSFTSSEADVLAKKFNMPIAYDESADRQSWEELKMFMKKYLRNNQDFSNGFESRKITRKFIMSAQKIL